MTKEIEEMDKAVRCLALELPEQVWKEVNDRWHKCRDSLLASSSVQERAKGVLAKHWRKYAMGEYHNDYEGINPPPTYDKQFIIDAMVEFAGASSMQGEDLKAENERLKAALKEIANGNWFPEIPTATMAMNHVSELAEKALTK